MSGFGVELRPEDIIVGFHSLNWGMKDKNPLNSVRFYKSDYNLCKLSYDMTQPYQDFSIVEKLLNSYHYLETLKKSRQEVGLCYPEKYEEHYL